MGSGTGENLLSVLTGAVGKTATTAGQNYMGAKQQEKDNQLTQILTALKFEQDTRARESHVQDMLIGAENLKLTHMKVADMAGLVGMTDADRQTKAMGDWLGEMSPVPFDLGMSGMANQIASVLPPTASVDFDNLRISGEKLPTSRIADKNIEPDDELYKQWVEELGPTKAGEKWARYKKGLGEFAKPLTTPKPSAANTRAEKKLALSEHEARLVSEANQAYQALNLTQEQKRELKIGAINSFEDIDKVLINIDLLSKKSLVGMDWLQKDEPPIDVSKLSKIQGELLGMRQTQAKVKELQKKDLGQLTDEELNFLDANSDLMYD